MTLGGVRSELTAKPHPSSMMDTLPSEVQQVGGFRSVLACVQLSPSCPV